VRDQRRDEEYGLTPPPVQPTNPEPIEVKKEAATSPHGEDGPSVGSSSERRRSSRCCLLVDVKHTATTFPRMQRRAAFLSDPGRPVCLFKLHTSVTNVESEPR